MGKLRLQQLKTPSRRWQQDCPLGGHAPRVGGGKTFEGTSFGDFRFAEVSVLPGHEVHQDGENQQLF